MSNVAGDGEKRNLPENSRLMSKSICSTGLRWLWVVVAVLALDFGSKQWIPLTLRWASPSR